MAIAFDAASAQSQDASVTSTFAHTCSGSDRYLIVGVMVGAGNTVTGVTYNGVAMTQINTQISGGTTFDNFYLFGLVAPATGANNIVITASASTFIYGGGLSYTGVDQANSVDVSTTATSTVVGAITTSLTTTIDNVWLVAFVGMGNGNNNGNTITAGASTIRRTTDPGLGGWYSLFDSNAAKTPAGSHSLNFSTTGYISTPKFGINMTSIRPSVAATTRQPLTMMGVGS